MIKYHNNLHMFLTMAGQAERPVDRAGSGVTDRFVYLLNE